MNFYSPSFQTKRIIKLLNYEKNIIFTVDFCYGKRAVADNGFNYR